MVDIESSERQAEILQAICLDFEFDSSALAIIPAEEPAHLEWCLGGDKAAWKKIGDRDGLAALARRAISEERLIQWQNSPIQGVASTEPGAPAGTILCAPLIAGGETLGAVLVADRHTPDEAASKAVLLGSLASWLASELVRSRQISQLQAANQALETRRLELLRSRDTLRALFDSAPTSMYIIDTNYSLRAVNRSRSALAGEIPQRLVSRHCYTALFQRSDPCPGCQVGETFATGNNTRRIEQRQLPQGDMVAFEVSSFPILDEAGQVSQAILFEDDITEKRRLETSLAQAEKLAAIGQLAAGVAHEINNPLTAVIANAQLLQRALDDQDEDLREMALLIQQAGERAAGVVGELLDLSRQESIELAPVDVNATLHKALVLAKPRLAASGICLELNSQPGLPAVQADADRLVGVWLNLLINAMDAVGGEGGLIGVSSRQDGRQVLVTVSDNGAGIPLEHLGRVFEPFYTTKEPGRGTGLGLSISHRIVRQIGGDIRIESQPGAGTTLTVSLPVT
jgi:two-component system NtrC family sensor kinase